MNNLIQRAIHKNIQACKMTAEKTLKTFRERYTDITTEYAKELLQEIRQSLPGIPEKNRAEYLERFMSWRDNRHLASEYLAYYIMDTALFHSECFEGTTWASVEYDIHKRGVLAVWDDWKGYIPLNPRNTRGSIFLLLNVFELWQATGGTRKEEPAPVHTVLGCDKEQLHAHMEKLKAAGIINYNGKRALTPESSKGVDNLTALAVMRALHDIGFIQYVFHDPVNNRETHRHQLTLAIFENVKKNSMKSELANMKQNAKKEKRFNDICAQVKSILTT